MAIQALCPLLLGCLFLKTIFYSSFKFREKLRVWYRDFPYAPCPLRRPPPFYQCPPPEGTFIVTDEPTRTSAVCIQVTLGAVRPMGLDQCLVMLSLESGAPSLHQPLATALFLLPP